MNCNPKPEATCGYLLPDTCVTITDVNGLQACFTPDAKGCYRQSDFNFYAGNKICTINSSVTSILNSISGEGSGPILVTGLKNCDNSDKTAVTIHQNFQDLYDQICDLQTDLSLPITGIDTKCLVDPCGDPISTLGQLLQVMINKLCDCCPA